MEPNPQGASALCGPELMPFLDWISVSMREAQHTPGAYPIPQLEHTLVIGSMVVISPTYLGGGFKYWGNDAF